jgi:hypothetical protein
MEGIGRNRIDEIILRETGNSKCMQQQRRRDEKVNVRMTELHSKVAEQESKAGKSGSGK